MNKKNIIKYTIIILILISLLVSGCIAIYMRSETTKTDTEIVKKENVKTITGYNISLDDKDTKLYKQEYEKLENNLKNESVDFEEYAGSIAKLFIIDLYTMTNKINKYDVGGIEFIYETARENYTTNVTDTLYKYLEDNTKENRTQKLPEVKSIDIDSIENTKYTISDKKQEYSAYKISINWDYVEDLGYDNKAELIIINKEQKLYIVEKN